MVAAVLHADEGAGALLAQRHLRLGNVPAARIELGLIGNETVDLVHRTQRLALGLCGATGHQQARCRMRLARAPDRLPRMAHRLARDRAGIDHHQIGLRLYQRGDPLALGMVEAAAERYDPGFAQE